MVGGRVGLVGVRDKFCSPTRFAGRLADALTWASLREGRVQSAGTEVNFPSPSHFAGKVGRFDDIRLRLRSAG